MPNLHLYSVLLSFFEKYLNFAFHQIGGPIVDPILIDRNSIMAK